MALEIRVTKECNSFLRKVIVRKFGEMGERVTKVLVVYRR